MNYTEYKKILDEGMVDYINNGGSVYRINTATKEFVFAYDDENMSTDQKERLDNRATQAILQKKDLPSGIRLIKCIWHGGY